MVAFRSFFALSLFALASVSHAQLPSETAIDSFLEKEFKANHSPAMSVAVMKDGKVYFAKGYGFANLENETKAEANTVYRLGSITKQFTSTMIMQMIDEGKLKLEQPVIEVLPDLPKAWAAVTIKQLLNHTSGIKSYTTLPNFMDMVLKKTEPNGIWKTVEKAPLEFEPGAKWDYNNTGYCILGCVIEKLDKQPYAQSLSKRITGPLGMTQTYFVSNTVLVPHRASGYSKTPKGYENAPFIDMSWPHAAGSMESTVLDIAKWDAALYTDKILKQDSLQKMWTSTPLKGGKAEPYGFGWQLGALNGFKTVEHGGGIHGFVTYFKRVPSKQLSVVVLSNCMEAGSGKVAADLVLFLDPSLSPKPIVDNEPKVTEFHKKVLQSFLEAKLDMKLFSPEMQKGLEHVDLKAMSAQFKALGPVNSFELLESEVKDGIKLRAYRVKFGDTALKVVATTDKAGLISGFIVTGL